MILKGIAIVFFLSIVVTFANTLIKSEDNNGNTDEIVVHIFNKAKNVTMIMKSDELVNLAIHAGRPKKEIYFSACLRQSTSKLEMKASEQLVFNDVITNKGGNYNSTTGMFVCTVPGDYWFSLNYLKYSGPAMWLRLEHNRKAISYARGSSAKDFVSVSRTIMVHLESGDVVNVKNHVDGANVYATGNYTCLSGFFVGN